MELAQLSSATLAWILALAFLTSTLHCDALQESIIGSRETCEGEGEDYNVSKDLKTKCIRCICKNGFVECIMQQCPSIEGCYSLLETSHDECCRRCTGCVRNGIYHASDTEWIEEKDPCRIFMCKAGVITESKLRCYTPCTKTIPAAPGKCCPVCAGCYVNGQKVTAERSVVTTEDPCVTCKCIAGQIMCAKLACPVLHCPAKKIFHEPGKCCPHCIGTANYLPSRKGACILGASLHNSGTEFFADQCTRCICNNSSLSCTRETCPVFECSREEQRTKPGNCCPQCPIIEQSIAVCSYGGKTYQDGDSWKLDSCKTCACVKGTVRCAMPICKPLILPCPPNSKLEHQENQCCPRCVESDGICTVFGDPHYRTFDGKYYTFKGVCRYQLVSDYVGHTFNIRVTNDAKSTAFSAWTKTIALKIGDLKVSLGQRMRVKVNGKKVDVPYRMENRLDINRTADSVIVSTQIGVKVLWDGISFLEVSVPTLYKGRLHGLCGNFNSNTTDEFKPRRIDKQVDPQVFGRSWIVGKKKECPPKKALESRKTMLSRRVNKERLCNRLKSMTFNGCHKKVNPTMYLKACLQDMQECPPKGGCYCAAFMAYTQECKRLGVQLPLWRRFTKCPTIWEELEESRHSSRRFY